MSTDYWTGSVLNFRCKQEMEVVFDLKKRGKAVYMGGVCLIIVIVAWLVDAVKNAQCDAYSRNFAVQKGYKYYSSSSGLRYTNTGEKVYK